MRILISLNSRIFLIKISFFNKAKFNIFNQNYNIFIKNSQILYLKIQFFVITREKILWCINISPIMTIWLYTAWYSHICPSIIFDQS